MSQHFLKQDEIQQLADAYDQQPGHDVLAAAIQTNGIKKVAKDPKAAQRLNRTFSVDLKATDDDKITDQKHAGFCWMFSTMNVLRHHLIKNINVKGFQLSSNYLFFWDKIERAHKYYLDVIKTADQPTNDRLVTELLSYPNSDGGEWDMAVSLIQKYGIIPASAFPRTSVANNTSDFNVTMGQKLRHDGAKLREMVKNGASEAELQSTQEKMLAEVYRITAISVGVPPEKFDFEYRDDKGKYHLDQGLSPKDFYDKYFDVNLDDFVPIANYPQRKMNHLYTQPYEINVVGGKMIHYLNLPIEEFKQLTIAQLKDGEPVWFGNDVMKQENTKDGYLDEHLYHLDDLFGMDLSMDKKSRFEYQQAVSSHAMTFTGVDLINDQPTKWQVENSWGAKVGENGYFVMSDDWMDAHVDEVIINKKHLSEDQLKMLDQEPTALMPWE